MRNDQEGSEKTYKYQFRTKLYSAIPCNDIIVFLMRIKRDERKSKCDVT